MFRTSTPCSCATLFRLKSLVTILHVVNLGQLDQLHVHFADGREVVFQDLDVKLGHLLEALEDIQAAAAAVALHGVGGIGHQLQLAQHELGDDDGAVDESGLGDIHDAAVDDHAGVQDLERVLGDLFPAEQSAQRRQVEHIALGRADDQAAIRHPGEQRQLKEPDRGRIRHGALEHQRDQVGA